MEVNFKKPEFIEHRAPTIAEQVFDTLHEQILSLELPPGTKLSEVDVAKQIGISRQPVRDAFFRLSQLGFLLIRPQRATVVRPISETEVLQAMYIRSALEIEVIRSAAENLNSDDLDALANLIEQQEQAVQSGDKSKFHSLDDKFHQNICDAAGVGFVWNLIKEKKAHMDRVRYLTLSYGASTALEEHKGVFEALKTKNVKDATDRMRSHLSRIKVDLPRIREEHPQYFMSEESE